MIGRKKLDLTHVPGIDPEDMGLELNKSNIWKKGEREFMNKIYYENLNDAIEEINLISLKLKKALEEAGVKYVLSSWIDLAWYSKN